MLSRPYAFNCILRLRTSTEFKPGHFVSHWASKCDNRCIFAYDVFLFFCSMDISSLIHNMRMFNTLFVVILMRHMLMTLILPMLLDFPGISLLLVSY